MDCSLLGFSVHGILQARTLEWVAISFSNAWKWKVKVKSLSCVRHVATPWTAAYQAPSSMGFSMQQYWSGVPLPSPSYQYVSIECKVVKRCSGLFLLNRYKPTPAQDWTELKGRQVDNIKLGSDQISDDLDRSELPIIHSVFLDEVETCNSPRWFSKSHMKNIICLMLPTLFIWVDWTSVVSWEARKEK